ncbi:MAG TPA: flagellar basal body-associated FliL family protein [Solimonas sp.]|nr:flagellar basal body-associated FliL family protein [Solimonas sp.]
MATASKDDDKDDAKPAAPAAAPKKGGGMGMLIVAVVLSVGLSAGLSWYFSQQSLKAIHAMSQGGEGEGEGGEGEAPAEPKAPAVYQSLDPAFVVNLGSPQGQRFLQVQVELMGRDPKVPDVVTLHAPRIRNALLLLFSQQTIEELSTREGKEKVQAAALAEVRNILKSEGAEVEIEALYFTSFVLQ